MSAGGMCGGDPDCITATAITKTRKTAESTKTATTNYNINQQQNNRKQEQSVSFVFSCFRAFVFAVAFAQVDWLEIPVPGAVAPKRWSKLRQAAVTRLLVRAIEDGIFSITCLTSGVRCTR
jgi:hypothetical protein